MTEQQIGARLARIESQLAHIDRSLAGPPTMAERVVRLEEWRQSLAGVASKVEDGKQHDAVSDAVEGERARARAEFRKSLNLVATIAGAVASIGATLGGAGVWLIAQAMTAGGG